MTKSPKVLKLLSSLDLGGTEKVVVELLKGSQDMPSIEYVTVVMNDEIDPSMEAEICALKYPVYFFKRPRGDKNIKYLFQLLSIIRKHNIQIIHAHNYGAKFWSMLCKCFLPYLKLTFTVHDTNYHFKSSDYWIHNYWFSANVAISKSVEQECLKHNIRKVAQIYNGVDVKKFKASVSNLVKSAPTSNKAFRIIQVARLEHQKKGQDILLHALRKCKDANIPVQCDFVGRIEPQSKKSLDHLQTMVKDLNLESQVRFLGNRTDIPELLQENDIFVLPSRYEGFGLVIVEAMAANLPIIVSNVDGPAELIQDQGNGLHFESGDADDLFKKIKRYYDEPELRQTLAEKAFNDANLYDNTVMAKNYLTMYEKALSH